MLLESLCVEKQLFFCQRVKSYLRNLLLLKRLKGEKAEVKGKKLLIQPLTA